MTGLEIKITKDTASFKNEALRMALGLRPVQRAVGPAVVRLVQDHLNALPTNKQGWPSTGFYQGAARGTSWDFTDDGVAINIDNEKAPGGMRQRYHGGPINMKDKLLTIPAAAAFYGHRATEFDLKFVKFGKTGVKALVVPSGGTGRVNFATGRYSRVAGAGPSAGGTVAYWLVEHVDQDADPSVLPKPEDITATAVKAVAEMVHDAMRRAGGHV